MWTKNGRRSLRPVLKQIDELIPDEDIGQKILVDDHSLDETVRIAEEFNWIIFLNPKSGISSGANEALRHVKTPFFVSVEQDLLLAKNWWEIVPNLLSPERVAIACGARIPNVSSAIRRYYKYLIDRNPHFTVSLDNTIYKTKILRGIGGFPNLPSSIGIDTVLWHTVTNANFEWKIATDVISTHLKGLEEELKHEYWYNTYRDEIDKILNNPITPRSFFARSAFTSPARGLFLALKHKCPDLIYFYPLLRLTVLKGRIDARTYQPRTNCS